MAVLLDCGKCPIVARSAFACLTPEQQDRLEKTAVPHAYSRGDTVFFEGNPALAVYCIRSGEVKLTRHTHHDGEVVAVQSTGDLMGYRAVLGGLPYCISATILKPSVVCTIARGDFLSLIEESHALACHLLERMAGEFRAAEALLVERNGERVAKRTARLLGRLSAGAAAGSSAGQPIPIPVRRVDLAHLLGTTPETLSRTLHGFAKRGLISLSRTQISVRDSARLARLAD